MPSGGSDIIWLDLPALNRGRPDWRGALRKYTVEVAKWLWGDRRDCRKIGGQAAIAIGGDGSLAGWNFCPKPEPSVPL